jgi:hypothetical protein
MSDKIDFFLDEFPNLEWSGPAWYKVKEKEGFPKTIELVYFKPIHLGTSGTTEVDGEDLGKILPSIYKKNKSLKNCYIGLIHSHHNMGAFFSTTDKKTSLEEAPEEGIFFSTVVSSVQDLYAFSMSYRDQYGISHFIEGDVESPKVILTTKEWTTEAKQIQKEADDAKPKYPSYPYQYEFNNWKKPKVPLLKQLNKADRLMDKFDEGEMSEDEFKSKLKDESPHLDPHLYVSGYYGID